MMPPSEAPRISSKAKELALWGLLLPLKWEPVEKVAPGMIGAPKPGSKRPINRALSAQTGFREGYEGVFQ
jgi:hypothetical protein